jgi:predicted nucleic acid-binding protein
MMTAIMVDSNVLLDLMTEDTRWLAWSAEAVEKAADRFRLVINPIIYAEVSRYSDAALRCDMNGRTRYRSFL